MLHMFWQNFYWLLVFEACVLRNGHGEDNVVSDFSITLCEKQSKTQKNELHVLKVFLAVSQMNQKDDK